MVDKSILTHIFECYQKSLEGSISRYSEAYDKTIENGLQFYDDFLKELIVDYASLFSTDHSVGLIDNKIEDFFHTKELPFVAIDGTCSADPFKDFMVFFAAAYGVRGKISITTDKTTDEKTKKIMYERWSMDQDVSIVSYIPIPYAEAGDITDYGYEDFIVDDSSKINLSHIHNRLMELSEVYLAYNMANSSTLNGPKIILMDRSLSGLLMSTDGYISKVHLFGHPIGSRQLKFEDGLVIAGHPINEELGVPTTKKFARWKYLVRELNSKTSITLDELEQKTGVAKSEWRATLNETYTKKLVTYNDKIITRKFDFFSSWFDSVRFFEEFCDRLFHKREAEALIYKKSEGDKQISRWMSPEDIGFLTNIGIRALVEKCWERRILLIGLAKDSTTKFFTENYIGIMRNQGVFPDVKVGYLPWTDRTLLEGLSFNLDELNAPWATTEFDSVYMSLRLERVGNEVKIRGNRGEIVNQERVFARSLGQFFKRSTKKNPMMGHVIFIDRLIDPALDLQFLQEGMIPLIENPEDLGKIVPAFFGTNKDRNYGQAITMRILTLLTRNLFPEVIGYPDPLHKADWGAKSVKKRVDGMIQSSEFSFRTNPLNRKFRTTRDSARR